MNDKGAHILLRPLDLPLVNGANIGLEIEPCELLKSHRVRLDPLLEQGLPGTSSSSSGHIVGREGRIERKEGLNT
jgi:hypothetical protein